MAPSLIFVFIVSNLQIVMTMEYCQTCSVGNAEMQGNRHSVVPGARVSVRQKPASSWIAASGALPVPGRRPADAATDTEHGLRGEARLGLV